MSRLLISIITLVFISSVSYSKIISFKECRDSKERLFNKDVFETYKFVIDTDKKIVNQIYVWTDKEIERQKKYHQETINKRKDLGQPTKHLERLLLIDKMTVGTYQITYIDDDYVEAELGSPSSKHSISIFLRKKIAEGKYEDSDRGMKQQYSFVCK